MELISLQEINKTYFSYQDPKYRSIKKWLKRNRIKIIKLGKKSFVKQDDFEDVLSKITRGKKIIKSPLPEIQNTELPNAEQKLYQQLLGKIKEL